MLQATYSELLRPHEVVAVKPCVWVWLEIHLLFRRGPNLFFEYFYFLFGPGLLYPLGIVQYSVRIYKSEQRSYYSWPTHPPLNPNIRDQKNLYAYGLSFICKIYSY